VGPIAANPNPALETCSDEEIVARILGGESALFEVIVRRHSRLLYRVALSVLRNDSDAEDVVQDTYVSAFQHLTQFAGRANFITWLTRIALYRALARLRSRRREVSLDDDQTRERLWLVHRGPSPEQNLCARETAHLLNSAIRSLPENYRRVLVLRDIQEIDTATTARQLRISETNVKVRLHRARTMLRQESAPAIASSYAGAPAYAREMHIRKQAEDAF
jgi:RNA polymerase sigma-70 factor (ECF subfamily)